MRSVAILLLTLTCAGCISPADLGMAPGGCATVRFAGDTAVTYQCGVPLAAQACTRAHSLTPLPHAGAFETVRCVGHGSLSPEAAVAAR